MSIIVRYVEFADYLTRYTPRNGYLYRLNPITKLTIFAANIVLGMYLSSPGFSFLWMALVFAATLAFLVAGGFPAGDVVSKQWRLLLIFFGVIFLANTFFGKTAFNPNSQITEIYRLVFFSRTWLLLSYQGLNNGISVSLFYASVFTSVVALVRTTRVSDLSYSLQKIGLPYSVAMIITITVRSVSLVSSRLVTVYNAQRSRGFELEKGWGFKTIRNIVTIFKPLVNQLLKTAYDMSIVFQARGLDFSSKRRTRLRPVDFKAADYAVILISLAATIALVAIVPPSFYG